MLLLGGARRGVRNNTDTQLVKGLADFNKNNNKHSGADSDDEDTRKQPVYVCL